jgi:KDO2-lipid IV(A) lauroyltransferase
MSKERTSWLTKFDTLRFAIAWCAFASMRLIVLLPFSWQLRLGKLAGRAGYVLLPVRRRVAEQNLRACFPDTSEGERTALVRKHFESLGASIVEMAMGWYGPIPTIRRLTKIEGVEHLERALDKGKGVILFSAHFTPFEFFFPALAPLCPRLCGMYKPQRNPLMNRVMTAARQRCVDQQFEKDSVRDMLRSLAGNAVVWYASDQRYGEKGRSLIPFFNEPAWTNTAISRIAQISGATVLPYFCRRLADDSGYVATIGAPLDDFPSDDRDEDVRRLTALLEAFIRDCPEQYWWTHKRFKGRPAEYRDVYATSAEH